MKMFRLRFILLGLLLCVCHVWSLTCGTEFRDVASSAHYAQAIVVGTVTQFLPPDEDNMHDAIVRVKPRRNIFKGKKILRSRLNFKQHEFTLTVGKFGVDDFEKCLTEIKRDTEYIMFLNMTTNREYHTLSALPYLVKSKRDLKKAKKDITKILCDKAKCVKIPTWDNRRRKMRNSTVEIGKPIELNCKLKRRPFPSALYKWYKNSVDISTLNITGLSIKNTKKGSRLKIKKSTLEDEGTYRCEAANVGGAIKQEAVIKISGVAGPLNPGRVMRDKKQKFNGTLKLTCRTKSGVKPRPQFFWYKDDKLITTGSRDGLTINNRGSESKLRKKNVVLSDEGKYTCVAKNAGGEAVQTSFVKVVGGPKKMVPCPEKDAHYCLNGGQCQILVEINKKFCTCTNSYGGTRCSEWALPEPPNKSKEEDKDKLAQDRTLIIVGIISGILLFIGICVVSYFLARRRREEFYRRRRRHQNGNIEDNIPQVYRPLIGCDEIDGFKKHMNGVVIHKETQTIETCFLNSDKGNLYINPMEGYLGNDDKSPRSRKPAISIEEDPSPEPATPEDSPEEFPSEPGGEIPKNKHSGSNSASDGAPNERLNDLSPRHKGQGRDHSKPTGAINSVPNIQGNDPTKPPAFNLDTDSEDDILSDGTPLTPLHISEEEDNNERNKGNNKQGSSGAASGVDKLDEKNRKNNTKESNEPKPIEPSELFPIITRKKDKAPAPQTSNKTPTNSNNNNKPPVYENLKTPTNESSNSNTNKTPTNENVYASSSSSECGDSDSSTTTEGCDSPTTLANLHAELGSDPTLNLVIKNNWNERGSPEAQPPPYPGKDGEGKHPGGPHQGRQPRHHGPRGPGPRGPGPHGHGPPRDHGPRGPSPHRGGQQGFRAHPPREHHGPRGPGSREIRDLRGDHPRDPHRDPRDHRDPREHRGDPRDPRSRGPPPLRDPRDPRGDPRDPRDRDPRDHRDMGPRGEHGGPRPMGPRESGPRPGGGPRELGSRGPPPPREPGSRVPPSQDQGPRDPSHKAPAPRPPENRVPHPESRPPPETRNPENRAPESQPQQQPQQQQNIPPFPVFSSFYDQQSAANENKERNNQRLKTAGRNQGPISL